MPTHFTPKLDEIEKIIAGGLDAEATTRILGMLGGAGVSAQDMEHGFLYSETLPKGREPGFTPMQRHLHFLWDAFDKLPLSLIAPFSIPFRRLLAGLLFEKRGEAFVCEENVRFNFGQFLSVGDNVFYQPQRFLGHKGRHHNRRFGGPGRGRAHLHPRPFRGLAHGADLQPSGYRGFRQGLLRG